jgi:F0F1-type ATP synthase membrane subunit b/b'
MDLVSLAILLVFALGLVVVVILLTRGVFARDLTQALKRVTEQERALQEKADILEQRIRQMEREYEAKIKRADGEAERIVDGAKQQAMNVRTAAIEEAKHRARQLMLEAEQGRALLKQEAARELDGRAARRACETLRDLLDPSDLLSLHHRLIQELLRALPRVEASQLHPGPEGVRVLTGLPLAAEEAQRLSQWAAERLGPSVTVSASTDASLVAGGVIAVGETLIDNSLYHRLNGRDAA